MHCIQGSDAHRLDRDPAGRPISVYGDRRFGGASAGGID